MILGHILQGKMDEAIWRTIIYSFHMPLFIGVSGFLFNVAKLFGLNLIACASNFDMQIFNWNREFSILLYFNY